MRDQERLFWLGVCVAIATAMWIMGHLSAESHASPVVVSKEPKGCAVTCVVVCP